MRKITVGAVAVAAGLMLSAGPVFASTVSSAKPADAYGCNCVTYVRDILEQTLGLNVLPGGPEYASGYGNGWLSSHDSSWTEVGPTRANGVLDGKQYSWEIYTGGRLLIMVWGNGVYKAENPGGHIAIVVNAWSHEFLQGITPVGSSSAGPLYYTKTGSWVIQVLQDDWPDNNGACTGPNKDSFTYKGSVTGALSGLTFYMYNGATAG